MKAAQREDRINWRHGYRSVASVDDFQRRVGRLLWTCVSQLQNPMMNQRLPRPFQNSFMGSPIVSGRISSPSGSAPSGPASLPHDLSPSGHHSPSSSSDKVRQRTVTDGVYGGRGPVSKVMDMFRNRSQSMSSEDKRKVNVRLFLFQFHFFE